MGEREYWVGFNLVKGIGAQRLKALITHFGSAEAAWQAEPRELQTAGLGHRLAERLTQVRSQINPEEYLDSLSRKQIEVLTLDDPGYPSRLREIDQPPPVLYMRGSLLEEDAWSVAIVGTRRLTAYGRQVTEELAAVLGANAITVVSGLARGVDALAHQHALKAGGRTLAVLGSGVDTIYPPEHTRLADEIIAKGALLSDYPPGTPPDASNFPPRNRIISGLARATVVIEAGDTSGALITAQFAVDQGREVFAVPGSILAPQSRGTNRLIAQGARPFLSGRELLESLSMNRVAQYKQARLQLPANETEASLLSVLSHEPLHVDEIRLRTGLPIERVSATLAMMELKGLVRQSNGMNFTAVREEQAEYQA